MGKEMYRFEFEEHDSADALDAADIELFAAARGATANAYAPYSKFNVGAAARLANQEIITGGNQENSSFPAGLCAEGVVMAAASARFPGVPVAAIAITYTSGVVAGDHPIFPCGICRQTMQEHITRYGKPIRLIMGGPKGKIITIDNAANLLPLAFTF